LADEVELVVVIAGREAVVLGIYDDMGVQMY
jgi:hypothetical protein